MRMVGCILLAWAALSPAIGEAQEEPGLVLMVPEASRAEWTAALQIELAARGSTVVPADPPEGETPIARDADAQRAAAEQGALAAAWVEPTERGWNLRLVGRDASEVRVTPISAEADPRTFALILVSLLDEPVFAPSPAEASATTDVDEGPVEDSAAPAPSPGAAAAAELDDPGGFRIARRDDVPPAAPPVAEPAEPTGLRWAGVVGTGGFAVANDVHFDGGALLRGGVALRLDGFEAALLADVGLFLEQISGNGSELQPLARSCLEAGGVIDVGVGLHFGGRTCVGFAEMRHLARPFEPFLVDSLGALFGVGGYAAVSVVLSSWIRLGVRAELDATIIEPSSHLFELVPVLATTLSFR